MWNYSQPVKIIFGNGQVEEIKKREEQALERENYRKK